MFIGNEQVNLAIVLSKGYNVAMLKVELLSYFSADVNASVFVERHIRLAVIYEYSHSLFWFYYFVVMPSVRAFPDSDAQFSRSIRQPVVIEYFIDSRA